LKFANASLTEQSPAMHYNKNMEKKREQNSKTEMVGDRNTRKTKTTRVSQHRRIRRSRRILWWEGFV